MGAAPERPPGGSPASDEPWIESPAGQLFFVNSLLAAPPLIVLIPMLAGALLERAGLAPMMVASFRVFPTLAAYILPFAGWLSVVPLWLIARNLRLDPGPPARRALLFYALLHLGFLGWTIGWWVFGRSLPGGT